MSVLGSASVPGLGDRAFSGCSGAPALRTLPGDLAGASAQLNNDLSKLMLDLGDSSAEGAGLLGALKSNSAKAGAADYQLALAMQNAQGYTNLRSEDIAALQKRQAQFKASLQRLRSLPTFHLSNAGSAEVKTVYTFQIGD